jgi:peptidoglycan/xylan/chitin deacetylase (PgdA/CDA1 family)
MKLQLAPLFPILHQILMPLFPDCLWLGNPQHRQIALTFDDGPHPRYTPELIAVLEKFQVKATFFWLGVQVERYPDIAKTLYRQGHGIGLHGYEHRSFTRLNRDQLHQSLRRTQAAIGQACGIAPETIRDVRPPNGLFSPQILAHLRAWHYRPVMWSAVPEDWVSPGIEVVQRRVRQQTQNGAIIVLHDGPSGGADVAANTAACLPDLLAQGYEFVTIDQLWRARASPLVGV